MSGGDWRQLWLSKSEPLPDPWPHRRLELGLGVAVLVLLLGIAGTPAAGAFDEAGFEEATATILCDCGCHPQSVHACACGRAASMRREIALLIDNGMTGQEVIERYVAEHGDHLALALSAAAPMVSG